LSLSHDQEEKYIAQIAQEFKIEGRLDSSPDDLSYGEAQRASLAAILSTPSIEVLLLDEPTKGLDSFMREFLLNLLRSLKARGATIIITSHDMDFIYELADSVLALQQGVIIAEGSPQAILSDITIRERCHLAPVFLLELCNELGIPPVRSSLELTRVLHARL
jgi:ABC-type multidrug transport system ATPase subunit